MMDGREHDPASSRDVLIDTAELRENTEICSARRLESGFELEAISGEKFSGRKLLIATGVTEVLPAIPGTDCFYGRSVWHCPYCDGYEHRD